MARYSDKPYMLGIAIALTLLVIATVLLLDPSFTQAQVNLQSLTPVRVLNTYRLGFWV